MRYIKQHHKVRYVNLLTSGKLNGYLADIDKQAEDMELIVVGDLPASEDNITDYFIKLREGLSEESP